MGIAGNGMKACRGTLAAQPAQRTAGIGTPLENKSHLGLLQTELSLLQGWRALGLPWALKNLFYVSKEKRQKGRGLRKYKKWGFPLLGSAERFGAVSCREKPSPGAPSLGLSAALTLLLPYMKIQQNENIQMGFSPGMD